MKHLIEQVINIAITAGVQIIACKKQVLASTIKPNQTYLTPADLLSHQIISRALAKLTPSIPILSEEYSNNHPFNQRKHWQSYWLIDPLDGTRNFIDGCDEFCTNIAYITNHYPVFGLIYTPVTSTCFYAHKDLGAFKKQGSRTTPLKAQNKHQPLKITIGHYSDNNSALKQHLKTQEKYRLYPMGSALKFAYIAGGKYDYYPKFGPCCEWDTAAGVCILECAGGQVVDLAGNRLCYNKNPSLDSPIFFARGKI